MSRTYHRIDAIKKLVAGKNWNSFEYAWHYPLIKNDFKDNQELKIDFSELTKAECEKLGLALWAQDNPLYLIPAFLYYSLKLGQIIYCIDGTALVVKENYDQPGIDYIDKDFRYGFLAYGFYPKDVKMPEHMARLTPNNM